jgi:polyhydroxybutyrate depolymerase
MRSRYAILIGAFLTLYRTVAAQSHAATIVDSVQVDSAIRSYAAHIPAARSRRPLLLAFHGAGGTGAGMQSLSELNRAAGALGWVVIYPDAALVNWAEGCGCGIADRLAVNDTGLVTSLITRAVERYDVDPSRVYAVGYSQGGLFAGRLACQMSDRIRAVAMVAAAMSAPLAKSCRPGRPMPVLFVQGAEDATYPPGGSGDGKLHLLGIVEAEARWRELDGCDTTAPCPVRLHLVGGGTHHWRPRPEFAAADTVTAFFRSWDRGP